MTEAHTSQRPAALARAARPDLRVGDTWRYAVINRLTALRSEETRRVLALTRDHIVCEVDSTDPGFARGRFTYTRQWNLVSRPAQAQAGDLPEDIGQWRWRPAYPQFRFPLAPGKSWRGTARVANSVTATTNVHRYVAQVLPRQRIGVPAGEFDTLPVVYEAEVTSEGDAQALVWRNRDTLHYAPAVRLFVRAEYAVTGPDGAPARDALHELIEQRRGA
jgi:hypothetical protein